MVSESSTEVEVVFTTETRVSKRFGEGKLKGHR